MRLLLSAIIALALGSAANASTILPGGVKASAGGNYELSVSDVTTVGNVPGSGNDLIAVTLTLTNVSGDADFDINGLNGVILGSNGALHNEQIPGGFNPFKGITAQNWIDAVGSTSTVDSYFIQTIDLPLDPPAEGDLTSDSGVTELTGGAGGQGGFGAGLTGTYSFATTAQSFDVAYLVFENIGAATEVDFSLAATNAAGVADVVSGSVVLIPEPSTVLLGSLAAVGFAARRRV